MKYLYKSIHQKQRPEDIAEEIIFVLKEDITKEELETITKVTKASFRQQFLAYATLLEDFQRPVGLGKQVSKAVEIFKTAPSFEKEFYHHPEKIEDFIQRISQEIHKQTGKSDFQEDRLNRAERQVLGLDISRRKYNKLFRHLVRLEDKLKTLLQELKKYHFQKIGRSALALEITREEFSQDKNTACFIAYYIARSNYKGDFFVPAQPQVYDDLLEMLWQRCLESSKKTHWESMAKVYPRAETLAHLSDLQKGILVGKWFTVLGQMACLFQELWKKSDWRKEEMYMEVGSDNNTWNNTVRSWNAIRKVWLQLLADLDLENHFANIFIGKVMRLKPPPKKDTVLGPSANLQVWNMLPFPWEVVLEYKTCTKEQVEKICRTQEIHPYASSWLLPSPPNPIRIFHKKEFIKGMAQVDTSLAKKFQKQDIFLAKNKNTLDSQKN